MTELAQKRCVPCEGGTPPLTDVEIKPLLGQLAEGWSVSEAGRLERNFEFPDFKSALAFTNRVGDVAEEQFHHPDILLKWGRVGITLYTHKINGLTESDFILAAKLDRLAA